MPNTDGYIYSWIFVDICGYSGYPEFPRYRVDILLATMDIPWIYHRYRYSSVSVWIPLGYIGYNKDMFWIVTIDPISANN